MTRRDLLASLGAVSLHADTAPFQLRWRLGADYPSYVKGGAMAAVSGAVVYAGGMTQPWRETEAAWCYTPSDKNWKPLPPMPQGRAYTHGAGGLDSLIVTGGRWRFHGTSDVFRLRRSSGDWRWDVLPSLQQARVTPNVAAAGSQVLVAGGGDWDRQQGGAFLPRLVDKVEVLDLAHLDQGWRTAAPFPAGARVASNVASAGGRAYLFGGYDLWYEKEQRHLEIKRDAWRYDFSADRWEKLPDLPAHMYGGAAVAVRDRYILILGGVLEWPGEGNRRESSVLVDPKRKVLLGQYSTRVLIFDVSTRSYTWASEPMPRGHNDIRACLLGDSIYVLGGENSDVTLSNTTADFQVATVVP